MTEVPEKTQEKFFQVTKQIYDRMVAAWGAKRSGCLVVEIHFNCGGTSPDRCQAYYAPDKDRL